MKWMPTCRETTELASRAWTRGLSLPDRIAMRLHLAICDNCARFNQAVAGNAPLFRAETAERYDAGLDGRCPSAHRNRIAGKARFMSLLQEAELNRYV